MRPAKESGTGKGSEQKQPKICGRHFEIVWFDEAECPCCKVQDEWLELTKDMG